ncbi:hypothetical protein MmiEs2_10870 [Methanimicrococcus stummii]|uniref:DUF4367 domain-containing protein n=1 Tax=Methanimicrococcus stummii TaxID=3028294 RepID=A0AA96V954_9EURY|nr:DUF4367 domain-containing protein [Methanimicrococcus sp. Es2]WNY28874.1 hypothetical protein MmiEs2_10870 [Methanimicrococcus sp. Es2]
MKKISILLLMLAVLLAVGISGCLGGDADDEIVADDDSSKSSFTDDDLNYSTNIVTVRDLPSGFEFLSTQSVKSHGEGVGITDVLYGYRGYYKFENDTVSNGTVYFYCFKTNSTGDAERYYQQMKNSYESSNGDNADVSTVTINGHDATKFTTANGSGTDMIAWTRGNLIFAAKGQVAGQIDYETLKFLAEASEL